MTDNYTLISMVNSMTGSSYDEFLSRCAERGISPFSVLEFAHAVGVRDVARESFKGLSVDEARMKMQNDFRSVMQLRAKQSKKTMTDESGRFELKGCGGCGGGTIK